MNPLVLALASLATLAASTLPLAGVAGAQAIVQRDQNQQHRIVKGARNGSLTPAETQRLETQQKNLKRTDAVMRAHDSGHLTSRDRNVLRHRQRRDSRSVYRLKHNGRTD